MKGQLGRFPTSARKICNFGAWVVGGAILDDDPKDIDLLIPWEHWPVVAALIPQDARPTNLGGWRWDEDGVTIDVWPDRLSRLLSRPGILTEAWHPLTGTHVKSSKVKS